MQRENGGKPVLRRWFSETLPSGELNLRELLGGIAKARSLKDFRCTTLLARNDYQFVQIEAPPVPEAELKEALRWKLRDLLDVAPETSTLDVLPVPASATGARPAQIFLAVAAHAVVAPVVQGFQSAGVGLEVIDVVELAQRNVAALFEQENRGLAFLAFGHNSALLTFTYQGELFSFRRIEIGCDHFANATDERREQLCERIVLEMQRSMDTVDRQFSGISLSHMIVALPPGSGLEDQFRNALYLPFEPLDLGQVMDLSAFPELSDPEAQRQALPTIGAALRDEGSVA